MDWSERVCKWDREWSVYGIEKEEEEKYPTKTIYYEVLCDSIHVCVCEYALLDIISAERSTKPQWMREKSQENNTHIHTHTFNFIFTIV